MARTSGTDAIILSAAAQLPPSRTTRAGDSLLQGERSILSVSEYFAVCALRLLKEENLACVPGSAFGAAGEGYLRLSYAYSLEELQEAMKRLGNFVNKLATESQT